MTDRPGLDFSFSGLKTAVLTALPADADEQTRADLARAFEEAVVDTLAIKCQRALGQTGDHALVVAGGVGANQRLRARLLEDTRKLGASLHFPRAEFCTDNAAMIAYAGWARRSEGRLATGALVTRARWPLNDLRPPA